MRVLIVGASGQVGSALMDKIPTEHELRGTYNTNHVRGLVKLDLSKSSEIKANVREFKPDIIFLTGASTNVDWCEENIAESAVINTESVKHFSEAAPNSKIIFFSSDYVFDGLEGCYDEKSLPNPINEYGKQKLAAEHYLLAWHKNSVIIRTNLVFGPNSKSNFIQRLVSNLQLEKKCTIPLDEWCSPTFAPELASVAAYISFSNIDGILHLVGPEMVNRYKLAKLAANIFGCNTNLVVPIKSSELNRACNRPLNGGLISTKIPKLSIGYHEALLRMIGK